MLTPLQSPSRKELFRRQCRTGSELPLTPDVSTFKQGQRILQWPQLSFQVSAPTKGMHTYKTSMCVASTDTQHGSGAMNFGKGNFLDPRCLRWHISVANSHCGAWPSPHFLLCGRAALQLK